MSIKNATNSLKLSDVLNAPGKKSIENEQIVQKILEQSIAPLQEKMKISPLKSSFNFHVIVNQSDYFMNIKTVKGSIGEIDIFSFEDAQNTFGGLEDEESFIQGLNKFTVIKIEKEEILPEVKKEEKVINVPEKKEEKASLYPHVPALFQPSAPIEWCQNLSALLKKSPDLRWVNQINADAQGISLADPSSALKTIFNEKNPTFVIPQHNGNNSALHKIVGWIIFAQNLFKWEDSPKKVEIIQKYALGKILNQCASVLQQVPKNMITDDLMPNIAGQVILSATQVLETMSYFYFFHSPDSKECLKGPIEMDESEPLEPMFFSVLENIAEEKEVDHNKTYVSAWDNTKNRWMFSKSGRLWWIHHVEAESWTQALKKSRAAFPKNPFFFCKMTMYEVTSQILFNTAQAFSQFCKTNKIHVCSLQNFNKLNGGFHGTLSKLLNNRSVDQKLSILTRMYNYFPEALSDEKWSELFQFCQKDQISDKSLLSIIMSKKPTRENDLMMLIAQLVCGEVKIALDCCRELSALSSQELESLPPTLRDRLLFLAYESKGLNRENLIDLIKKRTLPRKDVCERCNDSWPVFEAIYWSLRKSGVDMFILEKLWMHIFPSKDNKKS